jgi:hypothetical protein
VAEHSQEEKAAMVGLSFVSVVMFMACLLIILRGGIGAV